MGQIRGVYGFDLSVSDIGSGGDFCRFICRENAVGNGESEENCTRDRDDDDVCERLENLNVKARRGKLTSKIFGKASAHAGTENGNEQRAGNGQDDGQEQHTGASVCGGTEKIDERPDNGDTEQELQDKSCNAHSEDVFERLLIF